LIFIKVVEIYYFFLRLVFCYGFVHEIANGKSSGESWMEAYKRAYSLIAIGIEIDLSQAGFNLSAVLVHVGIKKEYLVPNNIFCICDYQSSRV
jgi:hypothetical protein